GAHRHRLAADQRDLRAPGGDEGGADRVRALVRDRSRPRGHALARVRHGDDVAEALPQKPIKYMPPTKHKEGDIFFSHAYDVMADLVAITTRQGIQILGMMTEAMHNPFLMDRYVALKSAAYVYRAARLLGEEITFNPDGIVARRQREVFD